MSNMSHNEVSSDNNVLILRSRLYLMDSTEPVYGLYATDKTPMYEMPLIYVFGGWGLGFWGWGKHFFVLGVLSNGIFSLAFCPQIH